MFDFTKIFEFGAQIFGLVRERLALYNSKSMIERDQAKKDQELKDQATKNIKDKNIDKIRKNLSH
jgi:hypothetical protein